MTASRFGSRDAIALSGLINPASNNTRETRFWVDGASGHPVFAPGGGLPACIGPVACIAGDGLPQGDPLNPLANGELLSPISNPAFGTSILTRFFDQEWANGWGKKHANWEFSGSVQHELASNVSMDVGYFRRRYINFETWDNLAVTAADFDTYTITVAENPNLPGGGGYPLTLLDMKPEVFGQLQENFTTDSDRLGGERETWHGIDANFSARLEGVLLQGGFATGKRSENLCGVQASTPEVAFGSSATFVASRVGGTAGKPRERARCGLL